MTKHMPGIWYTMFLCLFFIPEVNAQLCTGNLGVPIFTEDFGTALSANGQSPNAPAGFTTSHAFVGSGSIGPGQYAIVVNATTGNGTWYDAPSGDHTQNGNGYMMVIDADITPGVFFEKAVNASLCPGTTYEFSAWLANTFNNPYAVYPEVNFQIVDAITNVLIASTPSAAISPGASQMAWVQQAVLFTAPASGNPVKVRLLNNYTGSDTWGNDLAIDDIALKPCGPQLTVSGSGTFCRGQQATFTVAQGGGAYSSPQYQWQSSPNGTVWTNIPGAVTAGYTTPPLTASSPVYYRVMAAQSPNIVNSNCVVYASPVQIIIKPLPVVTAGSNSPVCSGQTISLAASATTGSGYSWTGPGGFNSNLQNPVITPAAAVHAGTYSVTATKDGCTSLPAMVNVVVLPRKVSTVNAGLCPGQSLAFGGQTITAAGSYIDTFLTGQGCDSIVTLVVAMLPYAQQTVNASLCQGQSYVFNGQVYTSSQTGLKDTFVTAGCDSIVTLNLTVHPVILQTTGATICQGQSYTFNGNIYTAGGSYSDTFTSAAGCDSITTLNLTIKPTTTGTTTARICPGASYTFGSQTITAAGTYTETFTAANGCDSVVTLTMIMNNVIQVNSNATICQGQSYTFNGNTYTAAGSYSDTFTSTIGCDSITTLTLTITPLPAAPITNPVSYCQNTTAIPLTATGNNLLWYTTPTGGTGTATAPTPSTTTPAPPPGM